MISKLKHIGIFIIFLVGLFFFLRNCKTEYTEEDAKKYLPGTYTHEIPSGELQIFKVNPDFTFEQTILSNNRKDTLYQNKGIMHVNKAKVKLDHWLSYYDVIEQKVLREPRLTSLVGPFWRKPKGQRNVLIIMFHEPYYIFEKTTSDQAIE